MTEYAPPKNIQQEIYDIFDQPLQITQHLCQWSKKYKYVYVETPKVACTTIKRVLQQAESDGTMTYEDPSVVHERERSPLLAPWQDSTGFVEAMRTDDYFRFCFVRNPFTRILSCYLDKMVKTEFERRRLAPQLGFDPETLPSFIDFLSAISEREDEENDIHWAAQTFLLRPNRVRYSFVGRFELFRDQFRLVCERLGILEYAGDLANTWHKTDAHEKIKE